MLFILGYNERYVYLGHGEVAFAGSTVSLSKR